MEFELDRTQINGFDIRLDTSVRQEETLEMIVPDACPDIQRIVETDGKVFLRGKEAMDGRVEVSGIFKLAVLYIPDEGNGVRHLDVTLPFTCSAEGRDVTPGCSVIASAQLCHCDARAVNPRKILVRAEAAVSICTFAPKRENICSQVISVEDKAVEQLMESQEVYLTACIPEKPFSLSDEVTLSSSRPAALEILKSRASLSCGDSKIIGNKLIFKGACLVELFYCGEDNGIYTISSELPISQIMEVSDVSEEAECDLTLSLSGLECTLSAGGEGRSFSVNAEVLAQAVIRETRVLEVLADAYSTSEPLVAERGICSMAGRLDRGVRSQSVREVLETPDGIREIVDCRLAMGSITRTQEPRKQIFTVQSEVQILYLDEGGTLFASQYPIEVSCAFDLPEDSLCLCRCEKVGDIYASPVAGGVEVRFSVDFSYCAMEQKDIMLLTDLLPGEREERTGDQPSLVLRTLEQGERLWDVAKAYGTTVADIISANELPEEAAADGKLLLIPGRR